MEKRANYALVGLAAIVLMVAMISFILWLSIGWNRQVYNTYVVYMNQALTGLNPDAPVEFNGVVVGSVVKISLNPDNPQQVILNLQLKDGTPVTTSTVATLAQQGITGIAYIALSATTADAPILTAIGNNPYPVITSAPSFFTQLDSLLKGTSNALQALLSPQNTKNITETLNNIRIVTDVLASHANDIGTTLEQTKVALDHFSAFTQQSDVAIGAFTNLLVRLDSVSRNLQQVTDTLKANPAALVRGVTPAVPGPGE